MNSGHDSSSQPQVAAGGQCEVAAEDRARLYWEVAIGLSDRSLLGQEIAEPAVPEEEAELFAAREDGLTIEAWDDLNAGAIETIRRLGLNENAVRLCARDTFALDAQFAEQLGHPDLARCLKDEHQRRPVRTCRSSLMLEMTAAECSFQVTGLTAGIIFCPCPVSGKILASRHALIVPSPPTQCYVAYYFSGAEPFFIVAAGFGGTKSLLYLPRLNLIVRLQNPHHQWGEPWRHFVRKLKSLACRYPLTTRSYLQGQTKPALAVGMIAGMGHWLWNDLSALIAADRKGDLRDVDAAIVGPYDYFDATTIVSSRFSDVKKTNSNDDIYLAPLTAQLFAVRPSGASVTREGAALICREAEKRVSEQQKQKAAEAGRRALLLWVNVRAHRKVWLNLPDELALLSRRLVKDFGDVGIYLDGMPDCEKVVQQIAASVDKAVHIYDGTNVPLYDTIYWSSKIDYYIATIGGGLIFVSWIAGKIGVAHGERQHLGQMEFWPEVRPDVFVPLVPGLSDIREEKPRVAYTNYTIEPGVMTELLYRVIRNNRLPRR